jgi:outer membrane protein TolC
MKRIYSRNTHAIEDKSIRVQSNLNQKKHFRMRLSDIATFLLGLAITSTMTAQSTVDKTPSDSLALPAVMEQVMANYPTLQEAQQAIIAANARVGLSKSAYYPTISFSSSYSHIGPVSSIAFPGLGTFNMFPADNYSAAINYDQTIYDFGKTAKNVAYANQNSELVKLTESQTKQQLSWIVVGNFFTLDYLQQAIRIKDDELKNLYDHLHFEEKKAATGSATEYEILTTKVRISSIENQKTDLETSLKIAQSQLNGLLGKPQTAMVAVQNNLTAPYMFVSNDSLISVALKQREEVKIANQKGLLAQMQLNNVNAANNPSLNFFANGGFKNGYIPGLNTAKANYVVGVSLSIPLFDATRTKYNRIVAKSEIQSAAQDKDLTQRNVINDVIQSYENVDAAQQKVKQATLQVAQAEKAYQLAETSFESGSITNLDLLDSAVSLAESRLSLVKTQIDYTVSLYKLKIALGEPIY